MSSSLDEVKIAEALRTNWLGRPVFYYPVVKSTNDRLAEMAARGAPSGTLLLAEYQSGGKGRHGRRWEAPARSSLLLSLLLRPGWPAEEASWLAMCAALAAAESIGDSTGVTIGLKWPNDLVVGSGGMWHKFGGLLLEGSIDNGRLVSAILGTGINVNMTPEQLPATATPSTSLSIASGRYLSRLEILTSYLTRLEAHLQLVEQGQSPQQAWNELLVTIGRPVRVSGAGFEEPIEGTAEGTDQWGRLLVLDSEGQLHTLTAGEVSLSGTSVG